ncbi:hypothetical protein RJ55_07532 [Drechmeria coniospora]|nr:hypothetical protein RJ55_07532 [Drechmeria coniospora]
MRFTDAFLLATLASASGTTDSELLIQGIENPLQAFTWQMTQNKLSVIETMTAVGELASQLQVGVAALEKAAVGGSEHNASLLLLGRKCAGIGLFIKSMVLRRKPIVEAHSRCYDMEHAIDDIQVQFYKLGLYINSTVAAEDKTNAFSYTEGILEILNGAKGEFTKDHCVDAGPRST